VLRAKRLWVGLIFVAGIASACQPNTTFEDFTEERRFPDASTRTPRQRSDASTRDAIDQNDGGVDTPDSTITGEYTWNRDIAPIIRAKCGLCHAETPQYGAPRSLWSYEDVIETNAFNQAIHELVAFRILATTGQMPPAGQPDLTMVEIEKILAWSNAGAPEGAAMADAGVPDTGVPATDGGIPLPWADGGSSPSVGPGLRWVDTWAHSETDLVGPYTALRGAAGTSYICFGFEIPPNPNPNALPESVILAEPFIDNYRHVHHMVIFLDVDRIGPDGPVDCILESFGQPVASWFPGRGATTLPPGTGVPIPPGARLSIEVHYDSVPNLGIPDMSGWRLLLSETQGLLPAGETWSGVDWHSPLQGPGDVTVTHTATNDFDNVTVFTATPHMHQRGLSIHTEYRFANDPPDTWRTLIHVDPWDFTHQILYPVDPPIVFNRGDQIRTTCVWTTSMGPVAAGASSQNEMCYTFMYHYRDPLLMVGQFVGPPDE
jgi:hypothetical protein